MSGDLTERDHLRQEAQTLMQQERYADALPLLERLHARADGKDAATYYHYIYCLHLAGYYAECLRVLDEAIAAHPAFSQLYAMRGATWQMFGEYEKMLTDCRHAVAIDPTNLHARYALSLRELMTSDLREGFEGYGDRMFIPTEDPIPFFRLPTWEGEALPGKRLLLSWEQGVGDIVMFSSFVPYLLGLGMRLTVTVPEKLHALFVRSFPQADIVVVRDSGDEAALEKCCDVMVLMGDLIELCLPHYRPAEHLPYLKADRQQIAQIRTRYQTLFPDARCFVGIAWHTTNSLTGRVRNIPLQEWQPLFDIPGVQYVSLQYGEHGTLPDAVYADPAIDAYHDIDALAAQISALDEVVTIQNATAHLAGALGAPATLLLSSASDWRWGVHREKGAWYDSVRILRQREPLVWQPVMEEMARRINLSSSGP